MAQLGNPAPKHCSRDCVPALSSQIPNIKSLLRALLRQWPEILQHRRNKLRDCRGNVHSPLQNGAWGFGIHDVEDTVNGLVARKAQQGGSEDLLRLAVDQNFHETLGLAFLE